VAELDNSVSKDFRRERFVSSSTRVQRVAELTCWSLYTTAAKTSGPEGSPPRSFLTVLRKREGHAIEDSFPILFEVVKVIVVTWWKGGYI
jgi:hypothetical protein